MKLDTKGYSRLPILNSTIFLNFILKMSFFVQIWSQNFNAKCFVQNDNPYKEYSEMLILNSTIVFTSSTLNYLSWENFVPELQSALFKMNLSTKGYSRVLILIHPKSCWYQHLSVLFVRIFILNKPL